MAKRYLCLKTEQTISDIYIEEDLLQGCVHMIRRKMPRSRFLIVTDQNVENPYSIALLRQMEQEGLGVQSLVLPPGEKTKSPEGLMRVYDALGEANMQRTDAVIALGGGVIGDLAGLAAATWQRGMRLIQIPTTLLAQIDSSIGGKTAIDLTWGKNMVGAFKQPDLVLIDPMCLKTLPAEVLSQGMAELIKYACIWDESFFEDIKRGKQDLYACLPDWIAQACTIKKAVVEQDEKDMGGRMILNFGHTVAHVLEGLDEYAGLPHGYAVAIGMTHIAKCGQSAGLTDPETAKRIEQILRQFDLPTDMPKIDTDRAIEFLKRDKKARDAKMNLILLEKIGSCLIHPLPVDEAASFLGWEAAE